MLRPRTWSMALAFPLLLCWLVSACATHQQSSSSSSPERPQTQTKLHSVGALAEGEPHSAIAVEADDAVWGAPEALVTLVAFLDFQCSFCAQGYGTLLKLREGYAENELRIVFKHLPLQSHDLSVPAAVAGQAVALHGGNGAFFDFAGIAFSRQASISYENLGTWAEEAGLDRKTYNQAVSAQETMQRIISDALLARRLGVEATPTFFVNGKVIAGAQPIETFRTEINAEIAAMKALSSLTWKQAYQTRLTENMRTSLVQTLLAQDPEDYRVPVSDSPAIGPVEAPVTLVVFSDFECPFCKQAEKTIWKLQEKHPDELRIVFKHLPLPFHDSARPAARLAVAVATHKGDEAFFSLSRDLFESSPSLDTQRLRALGRKYELPSSVVEEALGGSGDAIDQVLQQDLELSEDVLARGTPHFFINGKRLAGARPYEQFEALFQYEKQRAEKAIARGIAPRDVYAHLQAKAQSPGAPRKVELALPQTGPARGAQTAPVKIHVFSDFECPYCRKGEQLLARLESDYPGKLRIFWHDFPLPFHDNALPAARAARAAFAQKGNAGFWQMHDALFSLDGTSAQVESSQILAHAEKMELNSQAVADAMESDIYDAEIDADRQLASELGINGTPAFVIGGYVLSGAGPERQFHRIIDLVLEESTGKAASK